MGDNRLEDVIKFIAFFPIINSIVIISESLLAKDFNFKLIAKFDILSFLLGFFPISIIFAYLNFGYSALIFAYSFSYVIKSLLHFLFSPNKFKPIFDFKNVKPLLKFGLNDVGASFFNFFALKTDSIIVAKLMSISQLGYFARATNLNSIIVTPLGIALEKIMFSTFSKLQDDFSSIYKVTNKSMQLLNTLVLPLLIVVNFSAESIVVILLGNQWLACILPFQILSIAALFRVNYKLLAELIRAIARPDFVMKVQIISMVLILLFTIIGSNYGLVGVATGTVFAYLIQYILYEYFLFKYFSKWQSFILFRNIKIGILLSIVYAFIFLGFEYLLGLNNLYNSIISLTAFLILCINLLYFKTNWIIPSEFISLIPRKFKYGK